MARFLFTSLIIVILLFVFLPNRSSTSLGLADEVALEVKHTGLPATMSALEERVEATEGKESLHWRKQLLLLLLLGEPAHVQEEVREHFRVLRHQSVDVRWFYKLANHASMNVSLNTIKCLGALRVRGALSQLRKAAFNERSAEVREAATRALGEIGHPSSEITLKILRKDGAPEVREAARLALSLLGRPTPTDDLFFELRDKNADVAEQARRELLKQISPENAGDYRLRLGTDVQAHRTAVLALAELGEEAVVGELENILLSGSRVERELALKAYVNLAPTRCEALLRSNELFGHPELRRELEAALDQKMLREFLNPDDLADGDSKL